MFKRFPLIGAKIYTNYCLTLLVISLCAGFLVSKYPLSLWLCLAAVTALLPALLDQLLFWLTLAFLYWKLAFEVARILPIALLTLVLPQQSAKLARLLPGAGAQDTGVNVETAPKTLNITSVSTLRFRLVSRIYLLLARIPVGRYNLYTLGLAQCLQAYANTMTAFDAASKGNNFVCGPVVCLYQECAEILEGHPLASKIDLMLVYTLLSRMLFYSGSKSASLNAHHNSLQLYENLTEKECLNAAEALMLLGENSILIGEADSALMEKIGRRALSIIEQSAVTTSPNSQLEMLSDALQSLVRICESRDLLDEAAVLSQRHKALAGAIIELGAAK